MNARITTLARLTFNGCASLTSINIPSTVTTIEYSVFSACRELTSIVIPSSVKTMGRTVFSYCTKLSIYCEAASELNGWDSSWNSSSRPVYYQGQWEYVEGVPTPKENE